MTIILFSIYPLYFLTLLTFLLKQSASAPAAAPAPAAEPEDDDTSAASAPVTTGGTAKRAEDILAMIRNRKQ